MKSDLIITEHDDKTVIKITGKLEYSLASKDAELINAVSYVDSVIVDFSECDAIDSSGLGLLLNIKDAVKNKEKSTIQLIGCNHSVKVILDSVGFRKFFTIT